jgi:hypothetical protein
MQRLKFLNFEIRLIGLFFPDMKLPVGNVRYELLTKLQQNGLPIFHATQNFICVTFLQENIYFVVNETV